MLVKGARNEYYFRPHPCVAYLTRLITRTFDKSMTSERNHTEMTNFFFISISFFLD